MKAMTLYTMIFPPAYHEYQDYYIKLMAMKAVNDTFLCLGEITNMPEHYAIVNGDGKVIYGLHADLFVEATDDDLGETFFVPIED